MVIQSLFYIRFFKPPPLKCAFYQPFNIVWTIESDLGDRCFGGDLSLVCETNNPDVKILFLPPDKKPSKKRNHNGDTSVADSTNLDYTPYPHGGYGGIVTRMALIPSSSSSNVDSSKIQLCFSLAPAFRSTTVIKKKQVSADVRPHPVWHHAYPLVRSSASKDGTSYSTDNVWIIPTWSTPLNIIPTPKRPSQQQPPKDPPGGQQAQRKVKLGSTVVSLCEDVEQSIARHVWDCGLAMCDFLVEHRNQIKCNHVIELGSGTGLVGIAAALVLQPRTVTLTDLPDALEIMQQNIDLVGSTTTDLQAKVLSWGPKDSIHGGNKDDTVWAGDEQLVDLILLTDVLYNQGSHDLLLETLEWLMKSRNCKVLLAYKERNTDERVFFSKIKDRHWQCVEAAPTGDHPDSKYPFEMYWIQK